MTTILSEYCKQYYNSRNPRANQPTLVNEALGLSNYNYVIPADYKQMVYDFYFLTMVGNAKGLEEAIFTNSWNVQSTKGAIQPGYRGFKGSFYNDEQREELISTVMDSKSKLMDYMKKDLLDATYFAIASEFRYVLERNKMEVILGYAEDQGVQREFANWYKDYKYAEGIKVSKMVKKFLPDDDPLKILALRADVYSRTTGKKKIDPITGEEMPHDITKQSQKFLGNANSRAASYTAAKRAWKGNDAGFIKFAEECFFKLKWASSYGGEAWGNIAKGWMHLHNADTDLMNQVYIDHLFDLEHNTGAMLNKVQRWAKDGGWGWVKQALDFKRDAKKPMFEFWNEISPQMQYLGRKIRYAITGIPDDQLVENEFGKGLMQISLDTNSGAKAGKTGSAPSASATGTDLPDKIKKSALTGKPHGDYELETIPETEENNSNFYYMNPQFTINNKYVVGHFAHMGSQKRWFDKNYVLYDLKTGKLKGSVSKSTGVITLDKVLGNGELKLTEIYLDKAELADIRDMKNIDIDTSSSSSSSPSTSKTGFKEIAHDFKGYKHKGTLPWHSSNNTWYIYPQKVLSENGVDKYIVSHVPDAGLKWFKNNLLIHKLSSGDLFGNINTVTGELHIPEKIPSTIKTHINSGLKQIKKPSAHKLSSIKSMAGKSIDINSKSSLGYDDSASASGLDGVAASFLNARGKEQPTDHIYTTSGNFYLEPQKFVSINGKTKYLICFVPKMVNKWWKNNFLVYDISYFPGKLEGTIDTTTGKLTTPANIPVGDLAISFKSIGKPTKHAATQIKNEISTVDISAGKKSKSKLPSPLGSTSAIYSATDILANSSITKMSGSYTNMVAKFSPKKIAHTGPAGKKGEKSLVVNINSPKKSTGREAFSGYLKVKKGNTSKVLYYDSKLLPKKVKLHTGKSYVGPSGDKSVVQNLRFVQLGTKFRIEAGVISNAVIDMNYVEVGGEVVFINCYFIGLVNISGQTKMDLKKIAMVGCVYNGKPSLEFYEAPGAPLTTIGSRYIGPEHSGSLKYSFI